MLFRSIHTQLSWEIEGIARENLIEQETLRNIENRGENIAKEKNREKRSNIESENQPQLEVEECT